MNRGHERKKSRACLASKRALALGGGALLAWGRWQGRPLDCWVADVAVFARRNLRLALPRPRRRRPTTPAEAVPLAAINAIAGGSTSDLEPAA